MPTDYENLPREQLIELLRQRDRHKKLGLVWERDEIEADAAIDADFAAATPIADLHEGPGPWDNLVIEGDNYDALRWLRMTHAGRFKCIFIDPPYNTGNKDWVYNDHYVDKADRYRHSTWLEFLFRRLTLARDLLADDGVLLCCINDENRAKLELMMDEALPGMRLGSLAWRTRQGSNADQDCFLSQDHEYVVLYGGSDFSFAGNEKTFAMYKYDDNDGRGSYRKSDLTLGFSYEERPNLFYPLYDDVADVWYPPNPNRVWVYPSRERSKSSRTQFMEDWIEDGQVIFPDDPRTVTYDTRRDLLDAIDGGNVPTSGRSPLLRRDLPDLDFWIGKRIGWGTPAFKRYKKDLRNQTQPLSSWITPKAEADTVQDGANAIVSGTNDEGAKVIKDVFGEKAFNYAKPVSLVRELVRQSTGPGDLVLDFFAGSATTAQAVMELNAEDGGDRRFVMVSSTEATEDEPDKNLCRDVTARRIRLLNANDDRYEDLSARFAYLRTRAVEHDLLDLDLEPEEVWAALEARHGLPLTPYDADADHQVHEGEGTRLVFARRVKAALLDAVGGDLPTFVYAHATAQAEDVLAGLNHVEVRNPRDVLVKAALR